MRKYERRAVAWLSTLFLAVAGLAHAGEGRLIGKVVDDKGQPISGVTVTTTCKQNPEFRQVTTSNNKGVFQVDFPRLAQDYVYVMEKAGYVTLTISQNWVLQGTERHEFKMVPTEAPALGDQPPASTSAPAITAFNAGVTAFKAGNNAVAVAQFQQATQHDPNLRQAWMALATACMRAAKYPEAAEAADKAIALGATDAELYKTRWEAYRQLGDEAKTAQARADLEKIGRLNEEAKGAYNLGVRLSKAGDDESAAAKFKEALALDPNLRPALLGLATSTLKTGKAEEAYATAETMLKADSQDKEALKIRYNAALKLGEEAKLATALAGMVTVDPATAELGVLKLANAAFDRDDMATAQERYRQVLAINASNPRAHLSLGLILMREGKKAEARTHLERFVALAPNDPDAPIAQDALKYLK